MPALTGPRAAGVAAAVAFLVFANALGNGFAMDDVFVVRDNSVAHSIPEALSHAFSTYWPAVEEREGGLYRPLTMLSYAVDWAISGGRAWWLHLVNNLLHALATGLAVCVVLAWLPPAGALAAGLLFAVHPVHVEAVANVVGRAELLAACGILGAVLAARRYRRAQPGVARWWLGAALLGSAVALFSKESGAVALGVLAVDHWLDPEPRQREGLRLYLAVAALTVVFVYLWDDIAGSYARDTVAATIRWASPGERLATMFPAYLDVVRLLAWPMTLSGDYSPLLVPPRAAWTGLATLAAALVAALLALAFAVARKAPAVSFGVLVAFGTYLPTANLLFPSGVVLAERALYLAALAPACAVGWLLGQRLPRRTERLAVVAAATLLIVYVGRTATRTPYWRGSRDIVYYDALEHPQNYRARLRLGNLLARAGDSTRALSQYVSAIELFDDPFMAEHLVPLALALGETSLAVDVAERAYARAPGHPHLSGFLVDALLAAGREDSALATARRTLEVSPGSAPAIEKYHEVLKRAEAEPWRLLLARVRLDWVRYRFAGAGSRLDSAVTMLREGRSLEDPCWDLEQTRLMFEALRPGLLIALSEIPDAGCSMRRSPGGLAARGGRLCSLSHECRDGISIVQCLAPSVGPCILRVPRASLGVSATPSLEA
jgi:tetratricopeptide (TPR) repeat protein